MAGAHADDAFYKGKRLTILINFAVGGPTDIEGRLFAKHLARHIDGTPGIVVQNMDGAGGVVADPAAAGAYPTELLARGRCRPQH